MPLQRGQRAGGAMSVTMAGRKTEALRSGLQALGSAVVAYSGGVDSAFLAAVCSEALGDRALAVTADSPSIPRRELAAARELAARLGFAHEVIRTDECGVAAYAANGPDRCFHCKGALFSRLREIADARGFEEVLDGSNTDDAGDYRPGRKAAARWGVRSPLAEGGWTKADIREASRRMGLPTADQPASACLASRIPYGSRVTPEVLRQVERAEAALADLGFLQLRVRHHGDVARVELAPAEIGRLLDPACRAAVAAAVQGAGFRYAAVDLQGYRTGSLNETLDAEARAAGEG